MISGDILISKIVNIVLSFDLFFSLVITDFKSNIKAYSPKKFYIISNLNVMINPIYEKLYGHC